MLNTSNIKKISVSIFISLSVFANAIPTFAFQINDKANQDLASIIVKRKVSVNDQAAVSNFTIKSGNRIVTGDDASAIINLAGFGSIELFSSTILVINFSKDGVFPELFAGRIHIISNGQTDAKVKTPNGFVIAEKSKSKSFAVEIVCEDACTETYSEVFVNSVEIKVNEENDPRIINSNEMKSSGPLSSLCSASCKRPIRALKQSPNITLFGLIGGIGAAIIAGILISGGKDKTDLPFQPNRPVSPFS